MSKFCCSSSLAISFSLLTVPLWTFQVPILNFCSLSPFLFGKIGIPFDCSGVYLYLHQIAHFFGVFLFNIGIETTGFDFGWPIGLGFGFLEGAQLGTSMQVLTGAVVIDELSC